MTINELTETEAKNLLNNLIKFSDVKNYVDMQLKHQQMRKEMLQKDSNLADEQNEIEKTAKAYDEAIQEAKEHLNSLYGIKGNVIKKLNDIKNKRTELHKNWCFLKTSDVF